MLEDEVLKDFLEKAVAEARKEIQEKGVLTVQKAIPLLLRTQFNHILHLDQELTALRKNMDERFGKVDERFEKMDERFEKMDERFEKMEQRILQIFVFLGVGFTALGVLMALLRFFG